jgi:hypothetical protein
MSTEIRNKSDESRIAEEIMSVLPAGIARAASDDRENLRFSVRAKGLRLRSIVFCRASLRRLLADPLRAVKVEYLQRDLLRSAEKRGEFRYPRANRIAPKFSARVRLAIGLPIASFF